MMYRTLLLTSALVLTIAGAAAAQTTDTTKPATPVTADLAATTSEVSVSGKVVTSSNTELVMDSDAGQRMTFALDPKIVPATFTVGQRVTVQYHTLSGGTAYQASTIALDPQAKVETQAKVEPQVDETTAPASHKLPRTASNLPLIGLLGLLAVGGAVAVGVARP